MKKPKFIPEFDDIPTPRTKMPELALGERGLNFAEVELGFTEELALGEAARCLSCRRCIGCGLCLAECDRDAIVYDQKLEVSSVTVDRVVLATGSSVFDATLKPELGYVSSMNVVTTAELERMLSPTGPYAGLPLRPGDGRFPHRVAFIQCVGSREEGIGADYCSSTCCNDALELGDRLAGRLGDVELTVFHRGMRPLGRRGEELFRRAEAGDGPRLIMAAVSRVTGPDCDGPVTVVFDAGSGDAEDEFDLVVLSVGSAAGHTRGAARRFRADTNKFGFVTTSPLAPVESTAERILAAGTCTGPSDVLSAAHSGAAAAALASRGSDYGRRDPDARGTGAAGSPSRATAGESGDSAAAAGARHDSPVVVCVCEHGLSAAGLDPGGLVRELGRMDETTLAVSLSLACGHESIDRLRALAQGLDAPRVIVVGCFPRTHAELVTERLAARFDSPATVSLIGVSAVDSPGSVADRIRRLPVGRGEAAPAATAGPETRVLVLGGGLAGVAAALEAAAHGVPTTLVERSDTLGGAIPLRISLDPDLKGQWEALVGRVSAEDLIDVRLKATLTALEPEPGGFRPVLGEAAPGAEKVHGALIVATGAVEYQPPDGSDSAVLTQRQLAQALEDDGVHGSIAMIQCVGSRSAEHPWCSRVCCADALRNALRLKRADPDRRITILHRGIRVWGFDEELLSNAIDQGVEFVEVTDTATVVTDGALTVTAHGVGGKTVTIEPDIVVQSTGVEPSQETAAVARLLGAELAEDGFFRSAGRLACSGAIADLHVQVCGRAAGPRELEERIAQAQAAAGKACLFLKRGYDEA